MLIMEYKFESVELRNELKEGSDSQIKLNTHTVSPVPRHRFDDLIHWRKTTKQQLMNKMS